jgi:hypothetical protein
MALKGMDIRKQSRLGKLLSARRQHHVPGPTSHSAVGVLYGVAGDCGSSDRCPADKQAALLFWSTVVRFFAFAGTTLF